MSQRYPILGFMRKLALLGVIAVVALTGCGSPAPTAGPSPSATPSRVAVTVEPIPVETTVASSLRTMWEMIEPGDSPEIQDQLTSTICSGFETGVDYQSQVDAISFARGVNKVTADLMVHAAVEYTCPQYVTQLPAAS